MTTKKKKSIAETGTVLHKIKDAALLRPWAEYLAAEAPWKDLSVTADELLAIFTDSRSPWQYYAAVEPRDAKKNPMDPGFDVQYGLIIFTANPSAPPLEEKGGLILIAVAKAGHKNAAKYLLSAAERVLSDSCSRVYAMVGEKDATQLRLFKGQNYDEIGRAENAFKAGNAAILYRKEFPRP